MPIYNSKLNKHIYELNAYKDFILSLNNYSKYF